MLRSFLLPGVRRTEASVLKPREAMRIAEMLAGALISLSHSIKTSSHLAVNFVLCGESKLLLVWATVRWISSYLQLNAFLSGLVTSSELWVTLDPRNPYGDAEVWNGQKTCPDHMVESQVY